MISIPWMSILECFIFPLFGLGTFIPSAISSWDNVISFINREHYFRWDWGDHYTITSSRYTDCDGYDGAHLAHFVNQIGTNYIVFMYVIYFLFTTAAFLFGTCGSLFRVFKLNSLSSIKKFRVLKFIANFLAFCFTVPSFYAFKVHYGHCIKVEGSLDLLMNQGMQLYGNVGFWVFFFSPCLCAIEVKDSSSVGCIIKLVTLLYVGIFFAEAVFINFSYFVDLQVPWNIYLLLDGIFQTFLVCFR